MPDLFDPIDIEVLQGLKIITYIVASSIAFLIYDYFLTIPSEIQFVWRANWGTGKALYLRFRPSDSITILSRLHGCRARPYNINYFARLVDWKWDSDDLHLGVFLLMVVVAAKSRGLYSRFNTSLPY
ncbi:hypothetical protein EYR40_005846 [Pleurotus pulmonarius]|nr:hypothetical protein EYR40_005846 [Pleurotus pulmonarius]